MTLQQYLTLRWREALHCSLVGLRREHGWIERHRVKVGQPRSVMRIVAVQNGHRLRPKVPEAKTPYSTLQEQHSGESTTQDVRPSKSSAATVTSRCFHDPELLVSWRSSPAHCACCKRAAAASCSKCARTSGSACLEAERTSHCGDGGNLGFRESWHNRVLGSENMKPHCNSV